MPGLDLSALRPEPTAAQLDDVRRRVVTEHRPGASAALRRARALAIALLVGDLAAGAVLALVLAGPVGTVPAVLLGLLLLAGLLLASRVMTGRLRRAQLGGWARLDALARTNGLQVQERPETSQVPGRVLADPTARFRQVLRGERLEIGVVQHDRLGADDVSRSRYVACRAGRLLPWLLLAGPGDPGDGGSQQPTQLVLHEAGLRPPPDQALPPWSDHGRPRDRSPRPGRAPRVVGEDYVVFGDPTVHHHRDRLLPPDWRDQLAACGVGSLEAAGEWLVATLPPPVRAADPGEWERVGQVLQLLQQLHVRLTEVAPR